MHKANKYEILAKVLKLFWSPNHQVSLCLCHICLCDTIYVCIFVQRSVPDGKTIKLIDIKFKDVDSGCCSSVVALYLV